MPNRVHLVLALCLTALAACGGGGSTAPGAAMPPDPCTDLGYGPAAPGLAGEWNYDLETYVPGPLRMYENGTFVDSAHGGAGGYWGLGADGTLRLVYSFSTECPPTGSVLTAAAVTEASDDIAGTVLSSPLAGVAGLSWSISR